MLRPQIHFLISAPRSGSTWLARALGQHPEIFATEQRLFGNFFEIWRNNNGRQAPRITLDAYADALAVHFFHQSIFDTRKQFTEEFIREYIAFLADFAVKKSGKQIIVDKITPYPDTAPLVMEQIEKFLPDAKIIQLIRDGRDVVTSGVFDWLLKDATGTNRYQFYVDRSRDKLERFFDDDVVKKWSLNWRQSIEIFEQRTPSVPIKYEDLLDNFPYQLQRIFKTLEVDSTIDSNLEIENEVSFEKLTGRSPGDMNPTAKARAGIAGDWKKYFTAQDGKVFDEIAGSTLLKTGYESDRGWLSSLPKSLSLSQSDLSQCL